MQVFITGGSGFVGGHLIRRLRADGHAVVAAARSRPGARAVEQAGAEPWCGRLEDLEPLTRALDGIDAVVHAAARLQMWGPSAEFESANIGLTRSVLAAARRAAVPRFVQIGAASVVMDAPVALLDIDESARRTASVALPYSSSKARAEELVIAARADGIQTVVLRPPFIWGPGDAVDRDLGAAVARGRFGWFDGGRYPYATCHVSNLAEAVICALTVPDAGARTS
jgi:nucleoside-diphosphate-sugar epimerase